MAVVKKLIRRNLNHRLTRTGMDKIMNDFINDVIEHEMELWMEEHSDHPFEDLGDDFPYEDLEFAPAAFRFLRSPCLLRGY